jgi:hypothetical protein
MWTTRLCASLRLSNPTLPKTSPRCTSPDNPDLIKWIYPYYDSVEELSMDNKRKLHQANLYKAHPFAVQDYYHTFVLAATNEATYKSGQDIFAYSSLFEDTARLTPASFSHKITNSPHDTPFHLGDRFMKLIANVDDLDAMGSMRELLDHAMIDDTILAKLHGPITNGTLVHVKSALSMPQTFALGKLQDAAKENANILAKKYVWPMVESFFPNLAPFIKKSIEKLANTVIMVDFTKPLATWGPQLSQKLTVYGKGLGSDLFDLFTKGDGVKWLKETISKRFLQRPNFANAGEAGTEMGEFPMGEGWSFPESSYDDFLREIGDDDVGPGARALVDLDTIPEELEATEAVVAEVEEAVEVAAEASMAAVCGPLILMVAVTLLWIG